MSILGIIRGEASAFAKVARVPLTRAVEGLGGAVRTLVGDAAPLARTAGRALQEVPIVAGGAAPTAVARGVVNAGAAVRTASATAVSGGIQLRGALTATGGKPPVLLVPGYFDPDMALDALARHLRAQGRTVASINLFPNFAPVAEQAAKVGRAVDEVLARTGAQKVDLVGHSMGGLISRQFAERMGGHRVVDHLVTIGTPHYGTRLASLGVGGSTRDMTIGSRFLRELNAGPRPAGIKYSSIGCRDQVIIPNNSAFLQGAHAYPLVEDTGHLGIAMHPKTLEYVTHALAG